MKVICQYNIVRKQNMNNQKRNGVLM